jgi:2-phospho-L-lactate guanylyltransferase
MTQAGGPVGVAVPVRAFALGKARLADALDDATRAALARQWADTVLDAAGELPAVVISSDPDVREWATARGADVLDDPGSLDAAADAGRAHLESRGCTRVIVAHADLPHARSFVALARDGSLPMLAIVPCHRDDGTPVLSLPAGTPFTFAYGPGSFRRHVAEARHRGLGVRVVRDPALAFDVDVPDDLVGLPGIPDQAIPDPALPIR